MMKALQDEARHGRVALLVCSDEASRARVSEASRRKMRTFSTVALHDFAERGFEGTTLAGVARRLGVTQPLLHYYFGTKEGLWRHCVDQGFRGLSGVTDGVLRDTTGMGPRRATETLLRRLVHFMAANRGLFLVCSREAARRGACLLWMVAAPARPSLWRC